MLNTFKNEYLKLYRESKEQQWDNYFEGGNHDLGILDNKIYELVNKYSNKIESIDYKIDDRINIIKNGETFDIEKLLEGKMIEIKY